MNIEQKIPLIRGLMDAPMSGPDIERRSFEIIDSEMPAHRFTPQQWEVVRRMIHTVGDFGIVDDIIFSDDAISAAAQALRAGRPIYTDSNMIRTGLSISRLKAVCGDYSRDRIFCHVADDDVAEQARTGGLPRSLYAVRKASRALDGGIAMFGNAPVGLMELNRLILEEGIRPALVIGMPVGFVHVVESKEELMSLGVPYVILQGRRGGSTLAVSVLHALCSLADSL